MIDDYREPLLDSQGPADDEDEPIYETRSAAVGQGEHSQRLDKFLAQWLGEFSRSHLQGLIESGHVQVDGEVVQSSSRKLAVRQQVSVELVPTAQSLSFKPESLPLSIVFEDEHMLVLDKPSGLVVHPAAGNWSGTLLNGLLAHHPGAQLLPRAGIVHRLDKDTSGLMVVGKSQIAVTALARAIAAREVHRQYVAIAHGVMPMPELQIEAPVGRDPRSRIRMGVVSSGKAARTDVQRLVAQGGYSGVRCTLHTGRTHQIRVHMASKGWPLVGDVLYGGKPALGLTRQALHAVKLELAHPCTSEWLSWRVQPPPDFRQAWQQIDSADQFWA